MTTATPKRVPIVEDEIPLAEVLEEYLQASAFAVDRIADGTAVVPQVRKSPPDLLLLDLMLPGRDGLDICRELRSFTSIPIIMVTARLKKSCSLNAGYTIPATPPPASFLGLETWRLTLPGLPPNMVRFGFIR